MKHNLSRLFVLHGAGLRRDGDDPDTILRPHVFLLRGQLSRGELPDNRIEDRLADYCDTRLVPGGSRGWGDQLVSPVPRARGASPAASKGGFESRLRVHERRARRFAQRQFRPTARRNDFTNEGVRANAIIGGDASKWTSMLGMPVE